MSGFDMNNYVDVEPLEIETGLPDEVCPIMYTDEYKQVMSVARRLMQEGEYSERALQLTSKAIALAPAFYTVWNYRYSIVEHLAKESGDVEGYMNKEMDWLDEVTLGNPKNYQIWSYRQALLKIHPAPSVKRELPILQIMIDDDTKNYHVWSYRKWCILFFQDFTNELTYADSLIQRDVYNNSAWTHRMFVMKHTNPSKHEVREEIEYTKKKIEIVPQNVSSWEYLRGLYEVFLDCEYDEETIKFAEKFTDDILKLDITVDKEVSALPNIESSYALEFLADVFAKIPSPENTNNAKKAYTALSLKYDPIRSALWNHKMGQLA
ncbi:hypothetical protein Kpol_1057p11 [Vanderwaltozyma polyspora DSM 70294]|uniref:Protein farnesyltransferase/geranylgeranyltransferase type-1 subunit alpha n=1 Tax=Vanderwaltozyma polyspora (strain ATCC 22028 / DSM 70294 / BCRC 21397 / CBS 2163 / NBRC 10782 / NRRL Y-8283 / UCD 57-17) TaxID=436907 RepID=A7TPH9_VANPO|nr:uncharacterized protein Kpol_1057p11 [Vanderwaltozyma polyspora DSM 70294]EDO15823.1 hypothetical protein Kpol_1057p11 [Vanderwaltozyma polyspora DSM 70294]